MSASGFKIRQYEYVESYKNVPNNIETVFVQSAYIPYVK